MGLATILLLLQDPPVSLRLEERLGWIDGRLRFDEAPAKGDDVDVRDDLGLTRPVLATALFAGWRTRELLLRAEASASIARGSATPDAAFRWNESLFPAGEELDVELRRASFLLEARHGVGTFDGLRLEAGLRLVYDRRLLTIDSPSLGRDDDTLSSFSPEILFGAAWAFAPRWSLEADLSGSWFAVNDYSCRTLRGAVGPVWSWTETWSLRAGLRGDLERIVASDDIQRNEADLRQAAFFVGIEGRF